MWQYDINFCVEENPFELTTFLTKMKHHSAKASKTQNIKLYMCVHVITDESHMHKLDYKLKFCAY